MLTPAPPGEHMGGYVRAFAKDLSDLVDTKLNVSASTDALTRLAFEACTADVATWAEMTDLSEEELKQLYDRLSPGQVRAVRKLIMANQLRIQMPKWEQAKRPRGAPR